MTKPNIAATAAVLLVAGAFASEPAHWEYAGATGPAHWAELSPNYHACAGANQSPIDLVGMVDADLPPIRFDYSATGTEVVNNGHTIQVAFASGSSIDLDGRTFALRQFHFHAPSENLVAGESFPMEAHLVHADSDGKLAVIAVMFSLGEANAALAEAWAKMPEAPGRNTLPTAISATDILPAERGYYRFNGSLTTPPCSEGVRWLVMKEPVSFSAAQLQRFTRTIAPNNRPIQPLNARVVLR